MMQQNPEASTITLAAGVPQTIVSAGFQTNGVRILNWTASPVYVQLGKTGTPTADAPSDVIPAAANGLPGQLEMPFGPRGGLRVVGASAGNLTLFTW